MKKMDNKGLTLVELVIAIAISTMIVGAAGMFLYNAERTYRVAEHTINLQMEAQILMEQMSNWVMEGNRIYVIKDVHEDTEGSDVEEDGVINEGGHTAVLNDVLVIYYIPRDNGKAVSEFYPSDYSYDTSSLLAYRRVIFVHDGKLYMTKSDPISDAVSDYKLLTNPSTTTLPYTNADIKDENVIGDFVYRFHCDKVPADAATSELSSVYVTLGMVEGTGLTKKSYTAQDTFSLRNGLYVFPTPTPTVTPE